MPEKLWNPSIDTEWTPQVARIWTETSPKSRLKDINNKLNSLEWDKVNNLKSLIQRREYVKFQKEIWLTHQKDLDWKLWGISFDMLELYLKKLDQIKENEESTRQDLSSLEASITQPQETIQDNTQLDENNAADLADNTPWNTVTNWTDRLPSQDGGVTLASLGNGRQSAEQSIFNEWPNLWILWKKLQFDWTSKFDFVKPHLDDLNQLSTQSLLKLKKTVKGICISDKTVTSRKQNESLLKIDPRWYGENSGGWKYVWGCFRGGVVFAWRNMRRDWSYYNYDEIYNNNKEGTDSLILHEIWHAFDEKYEVSTRPSFQNFHKRFYNKIWSYFQQWWPWWTAWCSEFFAEASAEFHKWWEEWFTKYYSKDFYDYMKQILC